MTHRTHWYWSDWLGDQAVRRLTPAERGVWIDLLALCAAANPVGYVCDDKGRPLTLEEVARVTNSTPDEVAKLVAGIIEKGAANRDRTGRIYNRRMVREKIISLKRQRNGRLGGAATRLKWQASSSLPQQNAWQMPQQNGRASADPLSKKERVFLSEAPREEKKGLTEEASKRPSDMSRADLEAMFGQKGKPNGQGN